MVQGTPAYSEPAISTHLGIKTSGCEVAARPQGGSNTLSPILELKERSEILIEVVLREWLLITITISWKCKLLPNSYWRPKVGPELFQQAFHRI